MFNLIKPGHVLRFATCPSTYLPGKASLSAEYNDNTVLTPWPIGQTTLGLVSCLSHVSGPVGVIANDISTKLRSGGNVIGRALSYSALGTAVREQKGTQNQQVGSVVADFVGYTDGKSNFIQSDNVVFSKDFSGCLMVEYILGGNRKVAHVAASQEARMDCKQAFLDQLNLQHAVLSGWFKPFVQAIDGDRKFAAFAIAGKYMKDVYALTTFGVIANGLGYSIDAFKPKNIVANDWIVTRITPKTMSQAWNV